MKTWYCYDPEGGEEWFVEADTKAEAEKVCAEYFYTFKVCHTVSYWEAETWGLDTY